jgi:hypothetical protein
MFHALGWASNPGRLSEKFLTLYLWSSLLLLTSYYIKQTIDRDTHAHVFTHTHTKILCIDKHFLHTMCLQSIKAHTKNRGWGNRESWERAAIAAAEKTCQKLGQVDAIVGHDSDCQSEWLLQQRSSAHLCKKIQTPPPPPPNKKSNHMMKDCFQKKLWSQLSIALGQHMHIP